MPKFLVSYMWEIALEAEDEVVALDLAKDIYSKSEKAGTLKEEINIDIFFLPDSAGVYNI